MRVLELRPRVDVAGLRVRPDPPGADGEARLLSDGMRDLARDDAVGLVGVPVSCGRSGLGVPNVADADEAAARRVEGRPVREGVRGLAVVVGDLAVLERG
jgi:hypothetical protein